MVNRIPLFQTKTADTAHREFLQVKPGPFPDFWVGPGDEANMTKLRGKMATYRLFANCAVLGRCPLQIWTVLWYCEVLCIIYCLKLWTRIAW